MSILWLLVIVIIFIALFGGFYVSNWLFLILLIVLILALVGAL